MQNIVLNINIKLTFHSFNKFSNFECPIPVHMSNIGRFNSFLFFKLPAAWWCGVRLKHLDEYSATVAVRHRWINQNPFKSMFWAVQGMAAELSTGALVIDKIQGNGVPISMLVASNKAVFTKKARGLITFTCHDGQQLADVLDEVLNCDEGRTCWMTSRGVNEDGVEVATFQFEWTLKRKTKK